jgi:hypothetical protein
MEPMSEPIGYRFSAGHRDDRREQTRRDLGRVWRILKLITLVIVLSVVGYVVYEGVKPVTTPAEVKAWIASLPPDANRAAVKQLFTSKGVKWVEAGVIHGFLRLRRGIIYDDQLHIIVEFNERDHIKEVEIRER